MKLGKAFYFDKLMLSVFGALGIRYTANFNSIPESPAPDQFYNGEGDQNELPTGFSPTVKLGFNVAYRIR